MWALVTVLALAQATAPSTRRCPATHHTVRTMPDCRLASTTCFDNSGRYTSRVCPQSHRPALQTRPRSMRKASVWGRRGSRRAAGRAQILPQRQRGGRRPARARIGRVSLQCLICMSVIRDRGTRRIGDAFSPLSAVCVDGAGHDRSRRQRCGFGVFKKAIHENGLLHFVFVYFGARCYCLV